jgi:hypothetical protein
MLSLTTFADELECERAATRNRCDAEESEGRLRDRRFVFGYRNRVVNDINGRRSHVERVIEEDEAADRARDLWPMRRGARHQGDRQGAERSRGGHAPTRVSGLRGWAPSAIRSVLYRRTYLGEINYGLTG